MNIWPSLEGIAQDLRHALYALRRRPGLTVITILTVALAVGASTAIFSIVNAILIQPPPYKDASRLVILWNVNDRLGYTYDDVTSRRGESMSPAEFLEWKTNSGIFESMAGFEARSPMITGTDQPEMAHGYVLTEGGFPVIGIQPLFGRLPAPEEERSGSAPVALLRHDFWIRRFHGDPNIVGKTLQLNTVDHRIIGVLPPGFMFFNRASDYIGTLPFTQRYLEFANRERGLRVMARLKPNMTVQEAQLQADRFSLDMAARHPATNTNWRARVVSVKDDTVGKLQPAMITLLGAVALVLLIMCANIANLLLVQGAERAREFAVRVALGARRGRVIRQCLTESLLLSLTGGALGLALAFGIVAYFRLIRPDRYGNLRWLLQAESIGVDWRVVLFAFGTAVVTGTIFGLFPAFRASRPDLNQDLKESGKGSSAHSRAVGKFLVIAEVALGLILVVGATLLVRSFAALYERGPGFRSTGLLAFLVTLPVNDLRRDLGQQGLSGPEAFREIASRIRGLNQTLVAELAAIPGVRQVAATSSNLSIGGWFEPHPFSIEGRPYQRGFDTPMATSDTVSPNFFSAMGIPLMRGRQFSSADVPGGQPVTIINDELARRYFPNDDPIGKRIKPGPPESQAPWFTIVGVVGSIRRAGMEKAAAPAFYWNNSPMAASLTYVLQTGRNPLDLLPDARRVVRRLHPGIPSFEGRDLSTIVRDSVWQLNYSMILLGGLAALALLLTVVGVYGILSYSVRERTREIGVRIALGADRRSVLSLILRQGVVLVATGIGIGLLAAIGLTRFLSALLFGVTPLDWPTFAISSAILLAAGALASYLPARRATRIEPVEALRYQ